MERLKWIAWVLVFLEISVQSGFAQSPDAFSPPPGQPPGGDFPEGGMPPLGPPGGDPMGGPPPEMGKMRELTQWLSKWKSQNPNDPLSREINKELSAGGGPRLGRPGPGARPDFSAMKKKMKERESRLAKLQAQAKAVDKKKISAKAPKTPNAPSKIATERNGGLPIDEPRLPPAGSPHAFADEYPSPRIRMATKGISQRYRFKSSDLDSSGCIYTNLKKTHMCCPGRPVPGEGFEALWAQLPRSELGAACLNKAGAPDGKAYTWVPLAKAETCEYFVDGVNTKGTRWSCELVDAGKTATPIMVSDAVLEHSAYSVSCIPNGNPVPGAVTGLNNDVMQTLETLHE